VQLFLSDSIFFFRQLELDRRVVPRSWFRSRIVIIAYSGSLWNLSVRTRPTERYVTVQHREASRCVSCGTGVLSSLFVVRHTCTHVALVVLPTFPNITFSRCLVTIAPIIHIDNNSCGNFSRKTTNIAHNSSACDAIFNSLYTSLILHLCEFVVRVQSPKV